MESTDKLSPECRSANMSRIRSKDTMPEMFVRRTIHRMGIRYVLHDKRLPGTPDLVFPARNKVVFVHGCFWHGHRCGRGFKPKANEDFWRQKLQRNRDRDAKQLRELRRMGWRVLIVWECHVRHPDGLAPRLARFLQT